MKIPLKLGEDGPQSTTATAAAAVLRDVKAVRDGDWNAKNSLAQAFNPLLISLAEKRAHGDPSKLNRYMDAGKEGLFKAAKRFRPKSDNDNFQIFALDFIEQAMNRIDRRGGGMMARLFGK